MHLEFLFGAAVVGAGCLYTGIDGGGESGDDDGSGSADAADDGDDGSAGAACEDGEGIDPGPMYLRRLTHREYEATVRDLLGVDPGEAVATFPADVVTSSFDNNGLNQTISLLLGERYLAAAKSFAAEVAGDAGLRDAVIGCDPASAGCIEEFVARFGERAFRRPLSADEQAGFLALAQSQSDPVDQASIVIEAALQSPNFLFRVEIGVEDPDHPERRKLTGHEVATRLSYFLWGTMPSAELLAAAAVGELDDGDGVAAMAEEMLADPRAQETMRAFADQWFRLDTIADQTRDADDFPEFDDDLKIAMREELDRMIDDAMWADGADFLALYTTRTGFVNDALAGVYGVTPPGSSELVSHDFADDPLRGGLFTTAAFATASSRASETSPVQRAMYVRKQVLCDPPPPPPPNIPSIEPDEGESVQDAFERHIDQGESCAGCHLSLDPIGFGLERYDSIGRLRTEYASGDPVRIEGDITIDGTAQQFTGGVELGALVAASAQAEACVVTHAWRFALGRDEEVADTCGREQALATFVDSSHGFAALLVAVVQTDAFRYRRTPE
jgi:hypothetical protein